tara:strand:- start:741 stop:1697 length:957 start_codon:yes stop_codon:yes gene_type:complete
MQSKNDLIFDKEELFNLDKNLDLNKIDHEIIEEEIEDLVSNLWSSTCHLYKELSPLYSSYLQINLLRKLYIYYFSLLSLKKKYSNVKITNTNVLVDIIGNHLNFDFSKNLANHDNDFNLKRFYSFSDKSFTLKKRIKKLIHQISYFLQFKKTEIIFSDQIRLRNELKKIDNAKSVSNIFFKESHKLNLDVKKIEVQMKKNLNLKKKSIPNEVINELIEKRVINFLPDTINRIEQITSFIKRNSIKLVIASSSVHEEDLILLVAAKICNVKTMLINHGLTGCKNQFLDNYLDFQVTFSPHEYRYKGAEHFSLSADWSKQ